MSIQISLRLLVSATQGILCLDVCRALTTAVVVLAAMLAEIVFAAKVVAQIEAFAAVTAG